MKVIKPGGVPSRGQVTGGNVAKEAIKLSKLVVTPVRGGDITLTITEARELYEHLHELFGKKDDIQDPAIVELARWVTRWQKWDPIWYTNTRDSTGRGPVQASTTAYCAVTAPKSRLELRMEGESI